MSIKLSFCIPTYNRGQYIGETLESIISQATDDIEIVIVDGASTDNTSEVVLSFRERFPNLVYHRGTSNMGVDRDMAMAVELAQGQYCWLMSSDDVIKSGAVKLILEEIAHGYQIYLCNRIDCDSLLIPFKNTYWLSSHPVKDVFNLANKAELIEYFNSANSIGALFSFMSSIIFERKSWNAIEYNSNFNGSGYAHVFRLLSFIKKQCILRYIVTPIVYCRLDNDSFRHIGIMNRYLMDINGYLRLADLLFPAHDNIKAAFLKVMTREHLWYRLVKLRSAVQFPERWKELNVKLLRFGYNKTTLDLCNFLGRFSLIVNVLLNINRLSKKLRMSLRLKV